MLAEELLIVVLKSGIYNTGFDVKYNLGIIKFVVVCGSFGYNQFLRRYFLNCNMRIVILY